jgi:hypothetical protein
MSAPAGVEGGCICGAIRYRLTREPMIIHACHCRDCQKLTGTAFVTNLWIERKFIEMSGPEPVAFPVPPGPSGTQHSVFHCSACGTALWGKYHGAPGDTLFVRGGTLDDITAIAPDVHIYTRSKVPWLELPADARVFEAYYRRSEVWSAESQARWKQLISQ